MGLQLVLDVFAHYTRPALRVHALSDKICRRNLHISASKIARLAVRSYELLLLSVLLVISQEDPLVGGEEQALCLNFDLAAACELPQPIECCEVLDVVILQ